MLKKVTISMWFFSIPQFWNMLVIEKDFVTTEPVREGCQINPKNYLPVYFFYVNSLTAAAAAAKSLSRVRLCVTP